jgi:uncharacterized protein
MESVRFEWNDLKAEPNRRKHGVTFEEAVTVFQDPFYLESYDELHSSEEDRFRVIGQSSEKRLLVVSYVERRDRIRMVSTRLATKNERRHYEAQGGDI